VLVPRVAVQTKSYHESAGQAYAEREALAFYMFNHLFWAISQKRAAMEVLSPDELKLARGYDMVGSRVAKRLFYYTLLIISREARHLHNTGNIYPALKTKYGAEFVAFHKLLSHSGGGVVEKFQDSPPMMPLGDYVAGIADLFYNGSFSHGYGGKPWGDIAETLRKVVYGETSFEMFADTAFTLCHNGGPMFNKGMLYHMYEAAPLYKILDVQRSGQIPELVRERGVGPHVTTELISAMKDFMEGFPNESGEFVDWFRVEAAGALHKYPKEKQQQVDKHGHSKVTLEEAKKLASRFYLMPDVYVTKYERKVAA
jgi:hypothetical protein